MKILNAILGLGLVIFSLYLFFTAKTTQDLCVWFIVLLTGILFFVFYMFEEQKEEVERLRQIILKSKNKSHVN